MYDIDSDINAVQDILIKNKDILAMLDLTGKPITDVLERIIKKSKYDNLANSDKRICIFYLPSRPTRSEILFEELIEIDCHVPAELDYQARKIIGKIIDVLNDEKINGRYFKFRGHLGELATADGFYCHGVRFGYFSPV